MAKDDTRREALCVGGSLDGRLVRICGESLHRPILDKHHVLYWDPWVRDWLMEYATEVYEYVALKEKDTITWEAHYKRKEEHLRPKGAITFDEWKKL